MKRFGELAILALLGIAVIAQAQTSADYQAGIREATERYRGDAVGFTSFVIYVCPPDPLPPITPPTFTLLATTRPELFVLHPVFNASAGQQERLVESNY